MIFLSDNQHHQPQQFNKPSQPSPQLTRGHQPVQQQHVQQQHVQQQHVQQQHVQQQHVQQQHVQQQHVQQQPIQQSKPMDQVILFCIIPWK